jgi:KUP system potassium uptake protein
MSEQPGGGRKYMLILSLGALGVVYGDIGTSPLYAFREAFAVAEGLGVDQESVYGILSLMAWSLVLIVSVKYLIFVMRADNHGEGGILALTALLRPSRGVTGRNLRWGLIVLGLFGTALLYGDGIITPAISVLSAVEGIGVATPSLESYVVPIAAVVIIGLFSIQSRGTGTVGAIFGPVMIVWFAVLAVLGAGQIVGHPGVLAALSPTYGTAFVLDHPKLAFLALGAIFLVVTGSEALYADMGHFGRRPIRLGWIAVVFPALLLNYFGQGALLMRDPAAVDNPFYRMPPEWALVPLVVLATLATVIASQALISGAFSLTMQAVQLGYLPRMHVDHTSSREFGQIYVGSVNWALMVLCVGVVIGFGSSSNLAAAYGVAVTTTMVITTVLLYIVMRSKWRWSQARAASLTSLFLVIDLAFFAANIVKVPAGGWFPLVVGAVIFAVMTTWNRGRALMTSHQRRAELPIERFIYSITKNPQIRVPGTAVYLFPDVGAAPPAMLSNLKHNEVIHQTVLLTSVETAHRPRVPRARRSTVHDLGEGFHQVVLHFGFLEDPNVPEALRNIATRDFGFDPTDATYFLGDVTVIPSARPGMAIWRDRLFAVMHRNARSAAQYFGLPPDDVIEIVTQVEI